MIAASFRINCSISRVCKFAETILTIPRSLTFKIKTVDSFEINSHDNMSMFIWNFVDKNKSFHRYLLIVFERGRKAVTANL